MMILERLVRNTSIIPEEVGKLLPAFTGMQNVSTFAQLATCNVGCNRRQQLHCKEFQRLGKKEEMVRWQRVD